jgi:uncharacterized protein YecE (DUF72 family)
MDNWYIGTMGFSYKDWVGVFYPAEMDSRNYLAYYSRIFNAVEIDSTFYGTPRIEIVKHWAATTANGFKFCLKVPRVITHDAGLVGVRDMLVEFVDHVRFLEDKLGVVLFQFPPSFKVNQISILEDSLVYLPSGVRYAIEIRDQSWYTASEPDEEPLLARMLKQYDVAWAVTEYPGLPKKVYLTSDFLYLRWIGQHGSFQRHDYERIDQTVNLKNWWTILQSYLDRAEVAYGFMNNDYAGFAAGTANRFKQIAGMPIKTFQPPQQGTLL